MSVTIKGFVTRMDFVGDPFIYNINPPVWVYFYMSTTLVSSLKRFHLNPPVWVEGRDSLSILLLGNTYFPKVSFFHFGKPPSYQALNSFRLFSSFNRVSVTTA